MKKLYTMILNYNGGTYISQLKESSPSKAQKRWLLSDETISSLRLSKTNTKSILRDWQELDLKPVALEGNLVNVYCFSFLLGDEMGTVHFVQTQE